MAVWADDGPPTVAERGDDVYFSVPLSLSLVRAAIAVVKRERVRSSTDSPTPSRSLVSACVRRRCSPSFNARRTGVQDRSGVAPPPCSMGQWQLDDRHLNPCVITISYPIIIISHAHYSTLGAVRTAFCGRLLIHSFTRYTSYTPTDYSHYESRRLQILTYRWPLDNSELE